MRKRRGFYVISPEKQAISAQRIDLAPRPLQRFYQWLGGHFDAEAIDLHRVFERLEAPLASCAKRPPETSHGSALMRDMMGLMTQYVGKQSHPDPTTTPLRGPILHTLPAARALLPAQRFL